jgi:hypothetical protein
MCAGTVSVDTNAKFSGISGLIALCGILVILIEY